MELMKLIPYLVAFIVINFICYKTSGFYKQERKYIDRIESTINSKAEVVFLGDSHVETIKHLDLSENVGNLAFGADGINEMYIKVLTMLNYNENLKYIFIATEPQLFNNSISSNSTFLNKYLLNIDDTLNVYNKSKLNLVTERIPLSNDNYLKFVLNKIYSIFKFDTAGNKKDWDELTDSERIETASRTGKLDHNSIMTKKDCIDTYKKIVSICKSNNIKVIGIRFPVNEHYINQCKKEDIIKVDSFIRGLNLIKHLDYSNRITSPEYFHDEDHLNKRGVEKLSDIIFKETNIKITN